MNGDSGSQGAAPKDLEELVAWAMRLAPDARRAAIEGFCRTHPGEDPAALNRAVDEALHSLEEEPARRPSVDPAQQLHRLKAVAAPSGRYLLEVEVARGGMGVVWRVFDQALARPLAMKLILGQGDASASTSPPVDPAVLARFFDEAQVTGQLDHPGVVPVHELGLDADGRVYFTMRLVRGVTADAVFAHARQRTEGWTLTKALEVVLKVCDTLAYAHRKGVIHRDLKPSNVMVGRFGEVYVMDWGLAKVLGQKDSRDLRVKPRDATCISLVVTERSHRAELDPDSPVLTMDGAVVGTPCYMPPEQAAGNVEELGARSDVYAVGAMLYTLLTGRQPYVVPDAKVSPYTVLGLVLQGPPVPIHHIDRTVPAELVAICEKAMARARDARYPDTRSLAEDLRAFLENRVVKAHRTGALAEMGSWVRRNRLAAAALALAFLIAAGGFAGVSLALRREKEARTEAVLHARTAKENETRARLEEQNAAQSERRAREAEGVAQANERSARESADAAMQAWRRSEGLRLTTESNTMLDEDPALALLLAVEASERAPGALANNALWRALRASRELRTFVGSKVVAGATTGARFDTDGARVVTQFGDGRTQVWNVATGDELYTVAGWDDAVFSPDGRWLATASASRAGPDAAPSVALFDAASGRQVAALDLPASEFRLPDGSVSYRSTHAGVVRFLAGGRLLMAWCGGNSVGLWDVATRDRVALVHSPESMLDCVAGHERHLATAAEDRLVRVFDAANGVELVVLRGHVSGVRHLAFAPDGQTLASVDDKVMRLWNPRTGEQIGACEGHTWSIRAPAFSPDSALVASPSLDRTVRVWRTDSGEHVTTLRHEAWVLAAQFNRSGSQLATADRAGHVHVWDVRSWTEVLVLRGHEAGVGSIEYAADGRALLTSADDGEAKLWDVSSLQRLRPGALVFQAGRPRLSVHAPDPRVVHVVDLVNGEIRSTLEPHGSRVNDAAFDGDGARVLTAAADGSRLSSCADGRVLEAYPGGQVRAAAFSADGTRAAFGDDQYHVRLCDAATGMELWKRAHLQRVRSVAFDAAGERVVSASDDGTACVRAVEDGGELAVLRGHAGWVRSAVFSSDGKRIVTASDDGTARVWDAQSGAEEARLDGHDGPVHHARFSGDGRHVVTASMDGSARIWDALTGRQTARLTGHAGAVLAAEFSPDGDRVVTASADQTVRTWSSTTGEQLQRLRGEAYIWCRFHATSAGWLMITHRSDADAVAVEDLTSGAMVTLAGHEDMIHAASLSLDAGRIVTASDDKTARVWDLRSGRSLAVLRGHEDVVHDAVFSPDGSRLATASCDGTVRLWDARDGRELASFSHRDADWRSRSPAGPGQVAFSRDGQLIVAVEWGRAKAIVWSVQTGERVGECGEQRSWSHGAIHPDGKRVATCGLDGVALIWDATSGEARVRITTPSRLLGFIEFNADGTRLLTVAADGVPRVFDTESGRELMTLGQPWTSRCQATAIARFLPDGSAVTVVEEDGAVRTWPLDLLRHARSRLPRALTAAERARFELSAK